MKRLFKRKAFTITELVIVIAVIAILAAVLIPTFSSVIENSKKSRALSDAKTAWSEISVNIGAQYQNFVGYEGYLNGWFFDKNDNVAKYHSDKNYTVTYDGKEFIINVYDGSFPTGFIVKTNGSGTDIDFNNVIK